MESNRITRVVFDGVITNSQLAKMLSSVSNDVNVNIYTEQQLRTEQAMDQYISSRIENNIENLPIEPPIAKIYSEESDLEFSYFLAGLSQDLGISLDTILAWTNAHNIRNILEIRSILLHDSPLLADLPKIVLTYLRNRILGE